MNSKDISLRENEQILETVYHHLIVAVPHLFVSVLILALNFFLMYFLFLQGWGGIVLFAAVILAVIFYVGRVFFLYRKNKFIITNQRIIDFEQAGFFEKFVNEIPLPKIIEARAMIKGVGATLFHYGSLRLILSEELGPFEFFKIADPVRLQNKVNEMLSKQSFPADRSQCADSVALIMAEIELLDRKDKEEVARRIAERLRET